MDPFNQFYNSISVQQAPQAQLVTIPEENESVPSSSSSKTYAMMEPVPPSYQGTVVTLSSQSESWGSSTYDSNMLLSSLPSGSQLSSGSSAPYHSTEFNSRYRNNAGTSMLKPKDKYKPSMEDHMQTNLHGLMSQSSQNKTLARSKSRSQVAKCFSQCSPQSKPMLDCVQIEPNEFVSHSLPVDQAVQVQMNPNPAPRVGRPAKKGKAGSKRESEPKRLLQTVSDVNLYDLMIKAKENKILKYMTELDNRIKTMHFTLCEIKLKINDHLVNPPNSLPDFNASNALANRQSNNQNRNSTNSNYYNESNRNDAHSSCYREISKLIYDREQELKQHVSFCLSSTERVIKENFKSKVQMMFETKQAMYEQQFAKIDGKLDFLINRIYEQDLRMNNQMVTEQSNIQVNIENTNSQKIDSSSNRKRKFNERVPLAKIPKGTIDAYFQKRAKLL